MVREAVAQVLLFVAAISVSTMVVGIVVTEAGLYAQAVEGDGERTAAALEADVAIINDEEAGATYNATEDVLTVYVKNVGTSTLEPAAVDVLLDGEYVHPSEARVLGADGEGEDEDDSRSAPWRVDTVLALTIEDRALEAGDHRLVVDVESARDVLTFEVASPVVAS